VSKKVKVSKLELDIEGKKIELNLRQAKALQKVLNETFGDETIIYRDRYPWYNSPPYWISGNVASTSTDTLSIYLTKDGLDRVT
jgi:hypothetical protein